MTKLNKVEGAVANCPTCKGKIICKAKPAVGNYPAKLQWQNENGSAHYGFSNGEVTCADVQATEKMRESFQTQMVKTEWSNAELDEKGEELKEGLRAFKNIAYHLSKEEHPALDDQTNLFGQIVNANTSHLIQLALIKAIKTKGVTLD